MYSNICVLTVALIVTGSVALEDGDFIKIVSVSSGNVLTITGTDATEGKPLNVSPWSGDSNQKFLAVEAVVAGNSYLLMPQRQRYPWSRFIRNGGTAPYRDRHNDLPDWTMVLQGNTNTGAVTQEARDGKLYQQWRAEKVTGNKYLIKNRQNSQCLQAPGSPTKVATPTTTTTPAPTTTTTKRSFFGSIWSSIRSVFSDDSSSARTTRQTSPTTGSTSSSTNVIIATCDSSDERQLWNLEGLALEY